MNIREIIKKYLEENGYDGLVGNECGCDKDDLFPCSEEVSDCEPAYLRYCEKCKEKENCSYREEYDCNFCYSRIKQEEK